MAPDEHRHQHVFGDRRFVAKGVAYRDAARQCRQLDQFDTGGHRLDEPQARRRRIFRAPVIADEYVGICHNLWQLHQLLRIGEDLDAQAGWQFGHDAVRSIGRDIAEEERLHFTVCAPKKSSRMVMPEPALSGISISPSRTGNVSSIRSWSSGLAPSQYSTMNPAGDRGLRDRECAQYASIDLIFIADANRQLRREIRRSASRRKDQSVSLRIALRGR